MTGNKYRRPKLRNIEDKRTSLNVFPSKNKELLLRDSNSRDYGQFTGEVSKIVCTPFSFIECSTIRFTFYNNLIKGSFYC